MIFILFAPQSAKANWHYYGKKPRRGGRGWRVSGCSDGVLLRVGRRRAGSIDCCRSTMSAPTLRCARFDRHRRVHTFRIATSNPPHRSDRLRRRTSGRTSLVRQGRVMAAPLRRSRPICVEPNAPHDMRRGFVTATARSRSSQAVPLDRAKRSWRPQGQKRLCEVHCNRRSILWHLLVRTAGRRSSNVTMSKNREESIHVTKPSRRRPWAG